MKILITGGTGFIGSNLIEFYKNNNLIIQTHRGDNLTTVLNTHRPDVIINCAGEIYKQDLMYDTNVVMVKTILDWMITFPKTRLIHIGSSAEYGPLPRPSKETDRINPIDLYQTTKGMGTLLCQGYARQYGLSTAVARVYSAYGIYEKPHRLIPRLYNAFINNQSMKLYHGVHDFIYIDDFVRGIDLLVNHRDLKGDIINFGSGKQHTNLEVKEIFEKITNTTAPIDYEDNYAKAFESDIWCCDTSYAREIYGFKISYDLEDGIRHYIDKMKSKGQI